MSSSTTTPSSKEWIMRIPDHPNSLDKRLKARPDHLERIKPFIANKTLLMGGATLGQHPEEGTSPDMNGSIMLMTAESKEDVMAFLRDDPYVKGGVWNLDGIEIWAFKSAVRTQL